MELGELLFSCAVQKYNEHDGIKEKRILALTAEKGLTNIKGTQIKRQIMIQSIEGLSKSRDANNSQFAVHCRNEHDCRFEAKSAKIRDDLFSVI